MKLSSEAKAMPEDCPGGPSFRVFFSSLGWKCLFHWWILLLNRTLCNSTHPASAASAQPLPFCLKREGALTCVQPESPWGAWADPPFISPDHLCCSSSFLLSPQFSEQTSFQNSNRLFLLLFLTSAKPENNRRCVCTLLLGFVGFGVLFSFVLFFVLAFLLLPKTG